MSSDTQLDMEVLLILRMELLLMCMSQFKMGMLYERLVNNKLLRKIVISIIVIILKSKE